MDGFRFEDNSENVMSAIDQAAIAWLEEASAEMVAQTQKRSRRATGDTANKWTNEVDTDKMEAYCGNPLENAIWEEMGTGEYALEGNGRKGGWTYFDEKTGTYRHTYGKTPNRALHNSYIAVQDMLEDLAAQKFKEMK